MKKSFFPIILLVAVLLINACSPFTIVRGSTTDQKPGPIVHLESPASGYEAVVVNDVHVDVGVGSPVPVQVRVDGMLPDECSQLEYGTIQQDGTNFTLKLSAIPGGSDCTKAAVPFIASIPLNVVDLPSGSYSATVNGVRAEFSLETGNTAHELMTLNAPFVKRDIQVDNVTIVVGPGSALPVHAIIAAQLPSSCAWLGEIRLHRDGNNYYVQLLAYLPDEGKCNPEPLPFRLELPLNSLNLPDGNYSVNVNGTEGGFQLPPVSENLRPEGWTTYTSQKCDYMIGHPEGMQVTEQSPYSYTWRFGLANPDDGARSFLYASVVTPEIQQRVKDGAYQNEVYNYDPAATESLLQMQVGESKSVHGNPSMSAGFTYERQPDAVIAGQAAHTYVNLRPWEFPAGTKEIRYLIPLDGCTYLIGGYVDATGSGQAGAITEDLFRQIMATVQLLP